MSELLESAGYTKERTIDVTSIVKMYAENGYHYNDKQIDFIRSFGNLEIHYNHPVWNEDMVIKIDPIEAQKTITMDIVEEYNEFLDDTLLVIGEIERENMTLFLSQKGYFFGGYDDCLINWGNDFEKTLQNISDGNRGELKIID